MNIKKLPREIGSDGITKLKTHNPFNVGKLIDYLNSKLESGELSRDSLIFTERIEDFYFEENNWGVVLKENHFYQQYYNMDGGIDKEELNNMRSQYIPINCPVIYSGDQNLYIDLHY